MTICEHIKDNGSTCGSPALTGYSFCFFHQRLRQPRHRPGDFDRLEARKKEIDKETPEELQETRDEAHEENAA